MRAHLLEVPPVMIMGFHYTRQYSRRVRINVMGLVDQSTMEWQHWYERMHEREALARIAEAGYTLLETHFIYGFGFEGEREEIELTKKLVENAHAVGLKVLGYFQFFSVQSELFFLENPWAGECLQIGSDGNIRKYDYDRPALCFSHNKVRQYYLDGVELGLSYCDLDGIRLDNDHYKGCYCENCLKLFRNYLKSNFEEREARLVFGIPTLEGVSFVPNNPEIYRRNPLWSAMVRFRQEQRQEMMREISSRVLSIKPDAVLGGNPALGRSLKELSACHVYPPDLGETHHLVCAENAHFPAVIGNRIRHQVILYKHAQANAFCVYPSHHLHNDDGSIRWPESVEECALSMCEALCFGGNVVCTTWGMRMDGKTSLYERPHFLEALCSIGGFLKHYGDRIYHSAKSSARIGIYVNRESLISDYQEGGVSLQDLVQILLINKVPFRFIDRDEEGLMDDIDVLIVPNMRLVSAKQIERFKCFLKRGRIITTGEACCYDEYFLHHSQEFLREFFIHANIICLEGTPERRNKTSRNSECGTVMPVGSGPIMEALYKIYVPAIHIEAAPFVAVDMYESNSGENFIHLLNYDNAQPKDVKIIIKGKAEKLEIFFPDGLGSVGGKPAVSFDREITHIHIDKLHTYAVCSYK